MAFEEPVIREAKATATFAVRTFKINRDVLGRVQVERLQEIAQASEAIAEVPKKEHLELLVEYNREIRDIQLERWDRVASLIVVGSREDGTRFARRTRRHDWY